MKEFPVIQIWENCDPSIADAVKQFQQNWGPFSAAKGAAKSCHVDRLVERLIDPALADFTRELPPQKNSFILGAGTNTPFSKIVQLVGYQKAALAQHHLLGAFLKAFWSGSLQDRQFVATAEALLDLLQACERKGPLNPVIKADGLKTRRLNRRRVTGFCRFCGEPTEITGVSHGVVDPLRIDPNDKLKLSARYCYAHRPKLEDGSVNPVYRRAKKKLPQFDLELARLSRQAAHRNSVVEQSDDPIIDGYIYYYVMTNNLMSGYEADLRQHARMLVDANLTDRKKQILLLKHEGVNQSEIAVRLKITRQAVSKALKAIPPKFLILPTLTVLPPNYLKTKLRKIETDK